VFYVAAAVLLLAVLAVLVVMRNRKPGADLAGAMLLAVTFTLVFSPHYAWYFAWLIPFLCFYPVVGVVYLTCACSYLYLAHWPPTCRKVSRSMAPAFSFSSPSLHCAADENWRRVMPTQSLLETKLDPRRYFESADKTRSDHAARQPVCVYLETTNRCNLLCTTCPRTYEELEPPADMSWELFATIVDQIPNLQRAVLHGVGEPMLVKNLPKMVRYLKARGTYVLFNTNGTVLNERNGRALIDAGLDELRVSLDASNAKSYLAVRGKDYFNRILKNVRAFRALQEREGKDRPRGLGMAYRTQGNYRRASGLRARCRGHRRARGLSAAPGLL
jgi:hypothetical protein